MNDRRRIDRRNNSKRTKEVKGIQKRKKNTHKKKEKASEAYKSSMDFKSKKLYLKNYILYIL